MSDGIFHFVRHNETESYERLGWKRHDALDGTHHGVWSCLMIWEGEGEPVKPVRISHETIVRNDVSEASSTEGIPT